MGKLISWLVKVTPLRIGLGVALLAAVTHLAIETEWFDSGPLSANGFLRQLENKLLDSKFQYRALDPLPTPHVTIVAEDEKSVGRFGLLPWSRSIMADMLTRLQKMGAKVVAYDIIFSEEDKNSSYQTIKNFYADFSSLGLDESTGRGVGALAAEIGATQARVQALTKQIEAFEKEAAKAAPKARQALAAQLRGARKELGEATTRLQKLAAQATDMSGRYKTYQQRLLDAVSVADPDKRFAEAIAAGSNVILGYFGFVHAEEVAGLSREGLAANLQRIQGVTIDKVYDLHETEAGVMLQPLADPDAVRALKVPRVIGFQVPLERFTAATPHYAFFNVIPDIDGPLRRVITMFKKDDRLYPYIGLLAAARYLDAGIYPLKGQLAARTLGGINLRDDLPDVHTDKHGRMLVNYYANPQHYFPTVSAVDVVEGTVDPSLIKGKVVLIGATATGTFDQRVTPFSNFTPGVYVHAAAIQNIIDGRYLMRIEGSELFEMLFLLALGVLLALVLRRVPVWAGAVTSLAMIGLLLVLDRWVIFPAGHWVMVIIPSLQVLVTYTGITIYRYLTEEREKRHIRKAFQFYLTKSVVDAVLKDTSKLKLGGERKELTVLFSDIRGFTSISEKLPPEELVALLNEYLSPMTDLVFKYEGTLDKYMGDAIMAIYGAPVSFPDHAARACKTALEMMAKLHELQQGWRARGLPDLDIGIGLNTGEMSVGNMGSHARFDYTVMGDEVNLGSRLEGINKQYHSNIIISSKTYGAAKDAVWARELDAVRVKGKKEPIVIYELMGTGSPPPEAQAWMTKFTDGLRFYKGQLWDDAIASFRAVLELRPSDYPSQMYIERSEQMKQAPPGPDWDGVFTMTTK